jgi:pimeloyl-ACP methyl ester carboxylesterase
MHSFGDERIAPANGIELAYQEMGDADGQPLLLVMGLATQMLAWDEGFCSLLAERGFRVVRFDNRDIGRSTRIESAGVPRRVDMMLGRRASAPYLLRDMAADTTGLMDHLGIDSAHVVGASMGGMIVQTMAIEQPERVRSMVSIMSNTGSRWTGMPSRKAMAVLLGRPPRGREQAIERAVKTFKVIGSPGFPLDEERLRDVSGRSYDRGHSAAGVLRQLHAITASGDRTQALRGVRVPTTVIHGNSDPLVRPAGGRATARAIPSARLKLIDGMGHDLPRQLWPLFVEEIAANAARAGRGEAAKRRSSRLKSQPRARPEALRRCG